MAAKLPTNLIDSPRRRVSDLKAGETGYAAYYVMTVTSTGDCYLDPDGVLMKTSGYHAILIERRSDGYHVKIIAKGTSWRPGRHDISSAISVASVTEEYDPDLDWEGKMSRLDARRDDTQGRQV